MPDEDADENRSDWTAYKLAEDLRNGVPRSTRAPVDVAVELLRVREELREVVRLTRSGQKMAAAFKLGILAKSMDIDLDPDVMASQLTGVPSSLR